jgi:hypothetical protein
VEPDPFGLLERVDKVPGHGDVGAFGRERGESLIRHLPVGAALEVQQLDVHAAMVIVALHYKVKG